MNEAKRLSETRKQARREMRDMEQRWGKVFLEKSLHQSRFDYEALKRIAALNPPAESQLLAGKGEL